MIDLEPLGILIHDVALLLQTRDLMYNYAIVQESLKLGLNNTVKLLYKTIL